MNRTHILIGDLVMMRKLSWFLALVAALGGSRTALAVPASGNPSGTSTTTHYTGNESTGFLIVENIVYDPSAGQWTKELENDGLGNFGMGQIFSGIHVAVDESMTNSGGDTWTDWHQAVLSTNISPPGPGFLIDSGTMNVYRNGGLLTQGSDYTIVPVSLANEDATPDWISVSIFFSPSSYIQSGDTLRITEEIYEVFGDGNVWVAGESAVLGQYPSVPEPSTLILGIAGFAGLGFITVRNKLRRA